MSKILVAYILSLFGYPVWTASAPAGDSPPPAAVVDRAKAAPTDPTPSRTTTPRATANSEPPAAAGDSAKTDAGTPATTSTPAPTTTTTTSSTPGSTPAADTTPPATPPAPAGSTAPTQPDAPLTAADIVARVQSVYDGTTSFQANFRQVFRHRLNPDRSKEASGVVYLQKPGKMRWEYHDPERKLIVSDGTTLWAYEPSEDQVFEQSLENTDLPTAVTFLLGSGSLSAEFDARLLEQGAETSADRYVIELRPKTPSSQYARLLLVVRRSDFHVVRTVVIDHSGNTNSIEFAGERLNEPIPAAQFRFVRPEGARVIR